LTFIEADQLHWQILKLIWSNVDRTKPTHYEVNKMAVIQENILESIATNQFVVLYDNGELKAFASWWRLDNEGLEAATEGMKPHTRTTGEHVFITEATACKGYMRKLVARLRLVNNQRFASWHRSKNGKWFRGCQDVRLSR
jgi:hemolysin-activating ACP:hemolysin acyltransferase